MLLNKFKLLLSLRKEFNVFCWHWLHCKVQYIWSKYFLHNWTVTFKNLCRKKTPRGIINFIYDFNDSNTRLRRHEGICLNHSSFKLMLKLIIQGIYHHVNKNIFLNHGLEYAKMNKSDDKLQEKKKKGRLIPSYFTNWT